MLDRPPLLQEDDEMSEDAHTPNDDLEQPVAPLAGRVRRLAAVLVDGLIALIAAIPILMYFDVWNTALAGQEPGLLVYIALFVWGLVAFVLINYSLLDKRGQTVGKYLLGVAIVGLNGERKSAEHLLLRRYIPVSVATQIPGIGGLLGLIDALFIFGKSRRCIHDRIAGTQVVRV